MGAVLVAHSHLEARLQLRILVLGLAKRALGGSSASRSGLAASVHQGAQDAPRIGSRLPHRDGQSAQTGLEGAALVAPTR